MNQTAVERIPLSSITPDDFYRTYRVPGRPVIITGAFDRVDDWTLDLLSDKLGNTTYNARIYGRDYRKKPKREWKKYSDVKAYPYNEYAQMLRDRTAHDQNIYMAQVAFGNTPLADTIRAPVQELETRCDMERMVPEMDLNLWLGPSGHTEPLHFDNGDGTLMQLHGAKKVILFPPSQTDNLYPFPFFADIPPWFSQVDTDEPDFDVFPGYREALQHKIEVVIGQGDILFIPLSWWHEVSALGDDYVCSVNRFWKAKPTSRHFVHRRGTVFYVMNLLPWKVVMAIDGVLRKFFGKKTSA
jgi:lysine-specific demethylase 8/hypoxia-inducible factor 1-alpha inhibitor (HIF hydroxylase)